MNISNTILERARTARGRFKKIRKQEAIIKSAKNAKLWYLAGETSVKAPASKIVGSRALKAVNQNKK